MINGFFNRIQEDFGLISDYLNNPNEDTEQEEKTGRAMQRIASAVMMASSILIGVRAFKASSTLGAICLLATAVTVYVFNHDVFVISANKDKGLVDQAALVGKGLWSDLKDLLNGDKSFDDIPRYPHTEGTFLRPLWDDLAENVGLFA